LKKMIQQGRRLPKKERWKEGRKEGRKEDKGRKEGGKGARKQSWYVGYQEG
jgi:hypothetical protein